MIKHKEDSIKAIQEEEQEKQRLRDKVRELETKNAENEELINTLLGVTGYAG